MSRLSRVKTDKADCKLIAYFCQAMQHNFFGLADEMLLLRKVFLVKGKKCTALCLDKKKYYHRAVI